MVSSLLCRKKRKKAGRQAAPLRRASQKQGSGVTIHFTQPNGLPGHATTTGLGIRLRGRKGKQAQN